MKKILVVFFCFMLLFACLVSAGEVTEDSVEVISFEYTDIDGKPVDALVPGETILAKVGFIAADGSTEAVNFESAMLLYEDGKLVKGHNEAHVAPADAPSFYEISMEIPENVVSPSLVTVFWDSLEGMNPVCSPAYFGNDDPELYDIRFNGISLGVKKSVFDYSKIFYVGVDTLPFEPFYIPRDLTSSIVYNRIGNIINIGVMAHSGNTAEYSVGADVKVPEITVARYGYRGANPRYEWDFKTDLTQSGAALHDIYYHPTSEVIQGSSRRIGMDFSIPEIPEGYKIKSAKLNFYAKTTSASLNTHIHRTTDDWFDGEATTNWPAIKGEISTEPVEIKSVLNDEDGEPLPSINGFYKYTFEINPAEIVSGAYLPVTVKYDWNGSAYKLNILCSDANNLPYLEIELEEEI